jgi:hypothetical protein
MASPATRPSRISTRRRRVTANLACLLFISATTIGCGSHHLSGSAAPAFPSPDPSASASPRPTTSSSPAHQSPVFIAASGSPAQVVLTDADDDRGIDVVIGTLIIINYHSPPNPQWSTSPARSTDPSVLQLVDPGSTAWTGPLAEFRAIAVGNAVAEAGAPLPPNCACIPIPIGIGVTVVATAP